MMRGLNLAPLGGFGRELPSYVSSIGWRLYLLWSGNDREVR